MDSLLIALVLAVLIGAIAVLAGVWRLGGPAEAQAWLQDRLSGGASSSRGVNVRGEEEEAFWRSFERQIASAERRGDAEEAERLRREFEAYEEAWRAQRALRSRAPRGSLSAEMEGGLPPNRLTELRGLLERSRRLETLSPEDWALRGNAYLAVDDSERAADAYRHALQARPDDLDVLSHYATALSNVGRLREALGAYDQVLHARPQDPDVHTSRGNALADLGRAQEALQAYDQALQYRPDHAEALYNRGNVLSDLGRLDEAVDSYERALRVRPDLPDLHNDMGNTLAVMGRHEEALHAYEQAIKLRPAYARAYYNRGVTLTRLGQFEAAAEAFERCLRLRLDIPEAHYGKGVALARLGRLDDALGAFDRALALRPTFPDALFNKARAHSRLGQETEAIEWLRQAIDASPGLRAQALTDADFESLRTNARFRAVVEQR